MLLAYHLLTEREVLYGGSSSDGHAPRAVAFPLSEALPCIRFCSRWDAEGFRWKMNSYLEQLKMVPRGAQTSQWHSQTPLALLLPSEFFARASRFAPTLRSQLAEREGWSQCSRYRLFVLQEPDAAPRPDPPSSTHLVSPCTTGLTVCIQGKTTGQGKTKQVKRTK